MGDPERKKHFKGSVVVVFKDRESAQNFMDLESLKSPDEKEELIRKWQKDYLDEKDKEFEDKNKATKRLENSLKVETLLIMLRVMRPQKILSFLMVQFYIYKDLPKTAIPREKI